MGMIHYAIGQGGALITEIAALTVFHRCFSSYLHHIEHLLSIIRSSVKNIESVEYKAEETPCMTRQIKWEIPDASIIDVSQFSLTLVVEDDSGIVSVLLFYVMLMPNHFSKISSFMQVVSRNL